ncbi:MAG: rhomboid family intramembrane serine protease [Hydrococcus sp. Prado102]|jgi:membrane associated rhomboid family serine protease|nr:rhomboid family intramembrane serine protease [Hydrococcus sp. Prado102]
MYKNKQAYGTYLLIGINLGVFALEINSGGSENLETLYQLGALVPQEVLGGEWWRLVTANFLHFGWIHLVSNMLGLFFIGRFVEFVLGFSRFLIAYLFSGIGSMLVFSILTIELGDYQQILVGASAAIMGLVGVMSAIAFSDWRKEKSRLAAKRLNFILLIIGLQFIFDITNPQVSFLSHLLGLILGFLIGSVLLIG